MVENGGNENAMEAMDDGTWTASTCWRVYNRPKGEGGGLETVRIWAGPLPTVVASVDGPRLAERRSGDHQTP